MKIIFNHTFRSIKAKLGQPIIIIVTIAIVTVLLFASLSMKNIFYNFQLANLSRVAADTDVSIGGGIFSDAKLREFCDEKEDEIEYVDKYFEIGGLIQNPNNSKDVATVLQIEATDLKTFIERHKDKLSYNKGIAEEDKLAYGGILIGKSFADAKGYSIGDSVDIYLSAFDRYERFAVAYIFENDGFFANSTVYNALVDIKDIGDKGIYTNAYIKLKKGVDKEKFIEDLSAHMNNPTLEIKEAIDYEYIDNLVGSNEKLLTIALIFIIALVLFILFSAYTVVSKNRADEMVVFKAAGATPAQFFAILITEVLFYGIFGSIIGVIMARFGMQIAVMNVIPMYMDTVQYPIYNYAIAIALGIMISFIGALVPILRITFRTVRDLNSQKGKIVKKYPIWSMIVPIAIMIASILCIILLKSYSEIFTIVLIVAVAVLIFLSSPYLLQGVSYAFGRFKGISKLASVTIKKNSEAVALSCMLGVIVTFTFISVSLVNIIIDATTPFNNRFNADYVVQTLGNVDKAEEVNDYMKGTYGINYTCMAYYDTFTFDFNGQEKDLLIYAVSSSKELKAMLNLTKEEAQAFDNEDKAAIVSYDLMNRYGLKKGDKISFRTSDGDFTFNSVAIDTAVTANDRIIYLKRSDFEKELGNVIIFADANKDISQSDLYAELKQGLDKSGYFILRFDEWKNAATVGVGGLGVLLRFLEFLIGIVGFIGVINMTISMIMSRDREIGIFRSVGLDLKGYVRMLFFESLEISICGSVIGIVFSTVINTLMPSFAFFIDRYISISTPWIVPLIALGAIIIYSAIYVGIGYGKKIERIRIERNVI